MTHLVKVPMFLLSLLAACASFGQDSTDDVPPLSSNPPTAFTGDTIVRAYNLAPPEDTVKAKDVIAIKLGTQRPVSTFTTLYINGIKVEDAKPWKVSEYDRIVYFKVTNGMESLLQELLAGGVEDKTALPVTIAVGTTKQILARAADKLVVEVRQTIKWYWVLLQAVALLLVIFTALKHNALTDDNNLYFSLGRAQLFFWTILFSIAYLFICITTGTLPDIPNSILIILGISVGTTAVSKLIDNNPNKTVVIDPDAKSQGFLLDILSDGSSINIQRFQNVVFNVLFGIIFLQKVFSSRLMPSFDDNVMILLGISSGTFAGLKLTEATKEETRERPVVNTDENK